MRPALALFVALKYDTKWMPCERLTALIAPRSPDLANKPRLDRTTGDRRADCPPGRLRSFATTRGFEIERRHGSSPSIHPSWISPVPMGAAYRTHRLSSSRNFGDSGRSDMHSNCKMPGRRTGNTILMRQPSAPNWPRFASLRCDPGTSFLDHRRIVMASTTWRCGPWVAGLTVDISGIEPRRRLEGVLMERR